jgi:sulfide:quinone oxidoreductase
MEARNPERQWMVSWMGGYEALAPYDGVGSCYVEFGQQQVGRIDVNFLSGPKPIGSFQTQSEALVAKKVHFGSSRFQRWFGRAWSTKGREVPQLVAGIGDPG